jgi:hypothetical protein
MPLWTDLNRQINAEEPISDEVLISLDLSISMPRHL